MYIISIYTKENCKWCKFVKKFLNEHQILFNEFEIGVDIPKHKFVEQYPEVKTVPFVIIKKFNIEEDYDHLIATYFLHNQKSEEDWINILTEILRLE